MLLGKIRSHITGGFKPFIIRTSDGREFPLPHPEFVVVERNDLRVLDGNGDFDTIAPLHISSIRSLTPQVRNENAGNEQRTLK
jgi:hypothetical protein